MNRIWKRLLLVCAAFGLGAVAYALVRAEGERALRVVGRSDGGSGSPSPEDEEPARDAAPRRCAARTTSGKRCSREAEEGSDYCWQHAG
ncbi:MAG: hypothetical protein ACLF0P_07085 [Thermoanaerobaculia bacterium]